ncbi:MAG TPA: SGNH/GDSL hydrolase family protein [Thermomicrobiales bacterium]|nr:SGNH/GDSL hydrolase family protein [Thermomicrobiales bacterium]
MPGKIGAERGVRVKTVLCYGDSNTWGYAPATRQRYAPDVRWTGVLANRLGAGYRVIEEGLNGRTTRWDDPIELGRNGLTYLRPCVESHNPIDLMTIMLGTNDLKERFDLSPSDIAQSAAELALEATRYARDAAGQPAQALLVAPPPVARLSDFDLMFAGSAEKSRQFSHYYGVMAKLEGVPFFDAGSVVVSSDVDGIHFDADQHRQLGEALAVEIRRRLE